MLQQVANIEAFCWLIFLVCSLGVIHKIRHVKKKNRRESTTNFHRRLQLGKLFIKANTQSQTSKDTCENSFD